MAKSTDSFSVYQNTAEEDSAVISLFIRFSEMKITYQECAGCQSKKQEKKEKERKYTNK